MCCCAAESAAKGAQPALKRGVPKNHHQFFAWEVLDQIAFNRPKKTRKICYRAEEPFWMHCRHFLAPLWSQTSTSGRGQRRWSRSRRSEDATGRALLRPSQCPSHRQVATKTRDDARPVRGGCAGEQDSADDGPAASRIMLPKPARIQVFVPFHSIPLCVIASVHHAFHRLDFLSEGKKKRKVGMSFGSCCLKLLALIDCVAVCTGGSRLRRRGTKVPVRDTG